MATTQEVVSALPTKTLFVEMLTKDVSLPSAIIDLIDNCVDGALRIRGESSLEGLVVNLMINDTEFQISDNCGGIPLDIARLYVFRIGRPANAPAVESSVGLFGVGMKRSLFKLGRQFEVYSKSNGDSFSVKVDVESWQREEVPWEFPLNVRSGTETNSGGELGTTIKVLHLNSGVASQFAQSSFMSRLQSEISARHQAYLERGLTIQVNDKSVVSTIVKFAYIPNRLHPAYEEIHNNGVTVKLYCGIGEGGPSARSDAGWYVYCNGRMVVKADQTELTGWGMLGTNRIPRYHHQFARFRGCAFFNSVHSSELPWNTTKDGLDVEADLYRTVKLRMASHMRPVITFLNYLDKELEQPEEDKRVLTSMLKGASYAAVSSLAPSDTNDKFSFETPVPTPKPPETSRISFYRTKAAIDTVKRCLKVRTNKEVGERTFDWYLENECESDE